MHRISALLLLIAIHLIPSTATAEELELKGIKMGSSMEDFLKVYPFHPSGWSTDASGGDCPKEREGLHTCEIIGQPFPTIAGIWADQHFLFNDNKLVKITAEFESDSFEDMLSTFVSKYSKPTSLVKTEMVNGFGVTYLNTTAIWSKPSGEIRLVKYNYDINNSRLTFSSSWILNHAARQEAERSKAANKDL